MRIDNIRIEQTSECARLAATVTWEDRDRAQGDLYFATPSEYADAISARADVFLPAFGLLATWYGEARLKIEGSVCPLLFEGVGANLRFLRAKEGWPRPLPAIEVKLDRTALPRCPGERTGLFLSRGIDSLFELRRNLDLVPRQHPFAIQDLLHVQGAGFPEDPNFRLGSRALEDITCKFAAITADTGISMIPILSNLRQIAAVHTPHFARFWQDHFHKAAIASVAHAFGGRLSRIIMASGCEAWAKAPTLSDLPHNYNSSTLQVTHFASFSRFEKTRMISEWPVGRDNILVCTKRSSSNCGKCLKCLWARTALAALGKESEAFDIGEVDPWVIRRLALITPSYFVHDYDTLLAPLRAAGRLDLVAAVEELLAWAGPWDTWRDGLISDLSSCLPAGARFVLVDDSALQLNGLAEDRRAIPFLERDGRYWGSPPDDATAIAELERLRGDEAGFLAVAWSSAWWFDTYPRWSAYLRERFPRILENPRVTVFDLRRAAERSTAA
jgi:hypothetical protein